MRESHKRIENMKEGEIQCESDEDETSILRSMERAIKAFYSFVRFN